MANFEGDIHFLAPLIKREPQESQQEYRRRLKRYAFEESVSQIRNAIRDSSDNAFIYGSMLMLIEKLGNEII